MAGGFAIFAERNEMGQPIPQSWQGMETIQVNVNSKDVYEEVAKATDYTGSKLIDGDENARERILAVDDDLKELGRFWDESVSAAEEWLKEMLVTSHTTKVDGAMYYVLVLEVSVAWDADLLGSVESTLRSYFISSIIGQWFKFANKGEAADYLTNAADMLQSVERLLYTRRRPTLPTS